MQLAERESVAPSAYSNQTWDAPETDSESDIEHALSEYPSCRGRQSDSSDSSEDIWDSDDHSDSASSYSDESDASEASDASDESNSSSEISGEEKASDTSDSNENDDDVLLWDLQSQCTCRCPVHAPEMRAMI